MPYIIQLNFSSLVSLMIFRFLIALDTAKSWTDILIRSIVFIFSFRKNKSDSHAVYYPTKLHYSYLVDDFSISRLLLDTVKGWTDILIRSNVLIFSFRKNNSDVPVVS